MLEGKKQSGNEASVKHVELGWYFTISHCLLSHCIHTAQIVKHQHFIPNKLTQQNWKLLDLLPGVHSCWTGWGDKVCDNEQNNKISCNP